LGHFKRLTSQGPFVRGINYEITFKRWGGLPGTPVLEISSGGGWGGSLLSSLSANFLWFVLLLDSMELLLQSCLGATERKTNKKGFFRRKNKKVKKGDESVRFCASRYFCFHFFHEKSQKISFFLQKVKTEN